MSVTIRIENLDEVVADLRRAGADAREAVGAAVEAGAAVAAGLATSRAPGAIEYEMQGDAGSTATAHIGPPKEKWYYKYFEKGTPPHAIKPKGAKALKLVPLGEVFAAGVQHPGMAARPFLRPTVDENEGDIRDEVGQVLATAVGGGK